MVGAQDDWKEVQLTSDLTGFIRQDMGTTNHILVSETPIRRFDSNPWLRYVSLGGLLFLISIWIMYLNKVDWKRKIVEIYYDIDEETTKLYEDLLTAFKQFSTSKKIWEVHTSQKSIDTKYTSGASNLITRNSVRRVSSHQLPNKYFVTNVAVPILSLRNLDFYFLPERLLIRTGKKFAAINYKNVSITSSTKPMAETDPVPKDAMVIDHTWQYTNKDGGPDKRFKENRKIPICNYSNYHFSSDSGVNELIQTSKIGSFDNMINCIKKIAVI